MDRRTAIRTLAAATALPVIPRSELAALVTARRTVECQSHRPFEPAALSLQEVELVRVIADTILPHSETPSASEVGVHEFVDLIVAEWMDDSERDAFTTGLAAMDESAREVHGRAFLELTPDDQLAAVRALDTALNGAEAANFDPQSERSFFWWMKRLTLTGYFTSEAGAALTDYRIIPGAFEGCLVGGPA